MATFQKMHAPVWFGIERALSDVFRGGFPADRVLQRQFKQNPKLGSNDRKLFAEATYDIVRWWRRLNWAADLAWPSEDFARVMFAWCALNDVEVAARIPRVGPSADEVRARWNEPTLARAVRASISDWLDVWGERELGPKWPTVLDQLNKTAPVYLRANRLHADPRRLQHELARGNVASTPVGADGLKLARRSNVFTTEAFRRGWFEVQDLSSQAVADWVDPQPGERIVDACAGAGGKSLHLAARLGNRGRIVAMDVVPRKLEELRRRATRAGATCIETRAIEGSKTVKRLAESFDRVLLDVPCSGAGILRRNPDAKWRLTAEDVARVTRLQAEILDGCSNMCRPGGTMIYSTCSIMPSENERQVEKFVSRNGAWRLEGHETTLPTEDGPDGFFIARLTRVVSK